MTQSVYSYQGSDLHLILDDKLAENYNNAMQAYYDAQVEYVKKHNLDRMTEEAMKDLRFRLTDEQHAAYNAITSVLNLLIKINGGFLNLYEEDMPEDYLIKIKELKG